MLWMPMLRMRMLLTAGAPAPGIKSIKCIKRIEASPFRPKNGPEMAHLTHLMLLMLLMGVPPPLVRPGIVGLRRFVHVLAPAAPPPGNHARQVLLQSLNRPVHHSRRIAVRSEGMISAAARVTVSARLSGRAFVAISRVKTSWTTSPHLFRPLVFCEKSTRSACSRSLGPSAALLPRLLGLGARICRATSPRRAAAARPLVKSRRSGNSLRAIWKSLRGSRTLKSRASCSSSPMASCSAIFNGKPFTQGSLDPGKPAESPFWAHKASDGGLQRDLQCRSSAPVAKGPPFCRAKMSASCPSSRA